MESYSQLDASCGAAIRRLTLPLVFLILVSPIQGLAQTRSPTTDKITEVKHLYEEGRWSDVVLAAQESDGEIADLQLYRGLSLARLMRFDEARNVFETGLVRNPRE